MNLSIPSPPRAHLAGQRPLRRHRELSGAVQLQWLGRERLHPLGGRWGGVPPPAPPWPLFRACLQCSRATGEGLLEGWRSEEAVGRAAQALGPFACHGAGSRTWHQGPLEAAGVRGCLTHKGWPQLLSLPSTNNPELKTAQPKQQARPGRASGCGLCARHKPAATAPPKVGLEWGCLSYPKQLRDWSGGLDAQSSCLGWAVLNYPLEWHEDP